MKTNPIQIMSSYTTSIVLLLVYAAIMAAATIVEKYYGSTVTKALFYYSPLFLFLQGMMVINFIIITIDRKFITKKKWSYATIHFSLIIILVGAMTTHVTGEEGILHLREGECSNEILIKDGTQHRLRYLPFDIELKDFVLTRYPGSQSPSSYESYLRLHNEGTTKDVKVYMNNVLDIKGYRFYQASYDPDECGTILSVNHDAYGRTITYIGYTLLILGLVLMFFDRHSRFRQLWRMLNGKCGIALLLFASSTYTSIAQSYIIPTAHAEQFGQMPMQSANGRIIPVNTFANEIVRKFNVNDIIGNLRPEQILLSIYTYPADWSIIPLIEVKEEDLAKQMNWQNNRIAYRDAFDEKGYYKLSNIINQIYSKNPAERTRFDKEILKIDDRLNILHELLNRRLVRMFPNVKDSLDSRWYAMGEIAATDTASTTAQLSKAYIAALQQGNRTSDWHKANKKLQEIAHYQIQHDKEKHISKEKLALEVIYNNMGLLRYCQIGYLLLGAIMLLLSFAQNEKKDRASWKIRVYQLLFSAAIIFFLLHTLSLGMRWYISGYAPWSNSYETMVSLAWAGVLCGFVFTKHNYMVGALATIFGGVILFVSSLNWMDPQITPLVPVLKSPWLMAHVATLVISYGCLGISCMIGTAYLCITLSKNPNTHILLKQLTVINEIAMLTGTALLTVGIFLGAIWANESWGRYWSWDPKETWALITMIIYAALLHTKWMLHCSDRVFNWLSQWAILSILMTFLGVNYFLSGMHSYGSHDALAGIPFWIYCIFAAFFIIPVLLSYVLGKKEMFSKNK